MPNQLTNDGDCPKCLSSDITCLGVLADGSEHVACKECGWNGSDQPGWAQRGGE